MERNQQGSLIGTAQRRVVPIGSVSNRAGNIPRGKHVNVMRAPAVTAKSMTQAKHVYHCAIADDIVRRRLVVANSNNNDGNIPYRVRILPDQALYEMENELLFIVPLNGADRLAHNAGPQVRGYINVANATQEEFDNMVFGGVTTTTAKRLASAGLGMGGSDNMFVAMSWGVGDIVHRGTEVINAGQPLMWVEPRTRPDEMSRGSCVNEIPSAGMPPQVITPSIAPIKTGAIGFKTFSQTVTAIMNNKVEDDEIPGTGPVRSLKTSLQFVEDLFSRDDVVFNADTLEQIRTQCYQGEPLRLRHEENLILKEMQDAVDQGDDATIPRWVMIKWVITHFTHLAECHFDRMRKRFIGTARSNAGPGGILTFEVNG